MWGTCRYSRYTATSQWFKAGTDLSCSILEEKVTWLVARKIINRANNYFLHFPKTSNISVTSVYKELHTPHKFNTHKYSKCINDFKQKLVPEKVIRLKLYYLD
jgi:hypothetical protein